MPQCVKARKYQCAHGGCAVIGATEMNGQELPANTTEDVLINIAGVVDVIALDRQFASQTRNLQSELFLLRTI